MKYFLTYFIGAAAFKDLMVPKKNHQCVSEVTNVSTYEEFESGGVTDFKPQLECVRHAPYQSFTLLLARVLPLRTQKLKQLSSV